MRLCDDCIEKLSAGLSEKASKTLRKTLPLFEEKDDVTIRDFGRIARLNKPDANQIVEELKSKLLISNDFDGRKITYQLTETGKRLIELEEKSFYDEEIDKKEDDTLDNEEIELESEDEVESVEVKEDEKEEENTIDKSETKEGNEKKKEKPLVWDIDI